MFTKEQLEKLEDDLDSSRIKSREKGNINLSYLEGFDIIDTANKIFGYGNWSYTVSSINHVSGEQNEKQNHVICYKALIHLSIHDTTHTKSISREDIGFGTGIAKNLADAHENAGKEAITDGLKRALRTLGNQFGNSLYSKDKSCNTSNQNYKQQNNHQNYHPQNNISQDYTPLYNLGLGVQQQNNILVITGDGDSIFANKTVIKNHGFKWDGHNKAWWKNMEQGVA